MALLLLHDNSGPVQQFVISKPEITIGRSAECDISIRGARVSRKHARLVNTGQDYVLVDLESTHGTHVNGARVDSEVRLKDGDSVQLGDINLSFHASRAFVEEQITDHGATTTDGYDDLTSSPRIVSSLDASLEIDLRSDQRSEEKLKAIVRISKELAQTLQLDEVLERILETTFTIFPAADHAHAILYSPTTHQILSLISRHRKTSPLLPPPPSKTILQETLKTGRAFLSQDNRDSALFLNSDSLAGATIRTVLCSPMVSQDGTILGAIQLAGNQMRERFEESDLDVLVSVTSMAALAVQNARYHEAALNQMKLEQDLEFARRIQTNFLPRSSPEVRGYAFSHYCKPAQEVGGDYFDFIGLPDGKWAIVIADVSGKGFPAALYMARFSAEIRATLVGRQAPAKVLEYLNQDFYEIREGNIFITCALGILDPASHRLELALAGHPPPLIIDRSGRAREIDDSASGLPLGLFAAAASPLPYRIQELEIAPGDNLIFYTDGIIEAMSSTGEQYGVERLENLLRDPRPTVEALSASILEDVERFGQGKRAIDDTTLVCLRRQA